MNAYSYDPVTGEYLGATVLRESPLEPGVWLLPAHATRVEPPQAEPGHAVCWDGSVWVQEEDHRGQEYWNAAGQRVEITGLGPLQEGLSDSAPPAPEPDPYAAAPEYLDLGGVTVFQADHFYAAAQAEAELPQGAPRPFSALLEMLGL